MATIKKGAAAADNDEGLNARDDEPSVKGESSANSDACDKANSADSKEGASSGSNSDKASKEDADAAASVDAASNASGEADSSVKGKHAARAGKKGVSSAADADAEASKDAAAAEASSNGDGMEPVSDGEPGEASKGAASDEGDPGDQAKGQAQAQAAMEEAAEWKDKYVRLHAEWDTYRRRQKEQAEEQKALAAEKLVSNLILVIDDLERSIDYAQKNGETGLLGGVEAVLSKFIDTLKKQGVEVIDPKGQAFEALEAQAVGTVDDPSQPDETVAEVYQKGYKIGRKVLRPAMVTITQGGPAREKAEDASGTEGD